MLELLGDDVAPEVATLVELGRHHEQQHQELLVMDAKHVLSCNPLQPAYGALPWAAPAPGVAGWVDHDGGIVEVGHDGRRVRLRQRGSPTRDPAAAAPHRDRARDER